MSSTNGIRDNRDFGLAGDFLRQKIKEGSKLSIVSAFFTIYAYEALQAELDCIDQLDFLFGDSNNVDKLNPKDAKMEFSIVGDKLEIPLEKRLQQRALAKACSEWIINKVDIKSLPKPEFVHGKMYHIVNPNGVKEAIMGSSNFTVNGLGLGSKPNLELNLILSDTRDRDDLETWFQNVWQKGEDVKAKVLQLLAKLYEDNAPEFIYYKTLFHIFEEFLLEEAEPKDIEREIGLYETKIWNMLYDFQKDGVKGAINKINLYNGCIIADSVGLGKTYEALAIIKYYELKNHNVLVLCPKRLNDNWTFHKHNYLNNELYPDRFRYDVLYHTDLSRTTGSTNGLNLDSINWGNYDLVVIDESHNFRNAGKIRLSDEGKTVLNRYASLMEKVLKQGLKTKVLMLSATPVNNYLRDLRNQFLLITHDNDSYYSNLLGVDSINNTITAAQTRFTDWAKKRKLGDGVNVNDLMNDLKSEFFNLLDGLTIARSRKHITRFYPQSEVRKFPQRFKPLNIYAEIAPEDMFFDYDHLNNQILQFKLSVYNPSGYLLQEHKDKYLDKTQIDAFTQEAREHFLIGMMKVNLLKRLESSIVSFNKTLFRIIGKIDEKLALIEEFKTISRQTEVLEIDAVSDPVLDEDSESTELDEYTVGKKLVILMKHMDLDKWAVALKNDKTQLEKIYAKSSVITPKDDLKLSQLKELIINKVSAPFNHLPATSGEENVTVPNKKVLIFTAFSDTANYLYEQLKDYARNDLGLHISLVSGGGENKTTLNPSGFAQMTRFDRILTCFSPRSKGRKDDTSLPQNEEIDILIGTDCISEGQNLQDCDYMINYDIHWNPVRIIQRFGRIDRIGSFNDCIKMANFWPTKHLDRYIELKNRVETRMALVDLTATADDNLLKQDEISELIEEDLKYREKQLKRLQDEVFDLEDMDDSIKLSDFTLDDFRRDLLQYLQANKEALENAPLGMFALVPDNDPSDNQMDLFQHYREVIKPGIIFCLKYSNDNKSAKAINPLHPYYLVYIQENGLVRYNFASTKQILEIYQSLCNGKEEPYQELCNLFDAETAQGITTEKYSNLLSKALEVIKKAFAKRNAERLFVPGGKLVNEENQVTDDNEFVLITWLIIK